MPIYAFRCEQCEHAFDRLQKLSDPDPDACPACGAAAVRRELTAPAFRLAGSGWYETDFKKDGKRNLADSGDGAGKSDKSEPGAKPDAGAKPDSAAKPDAAGKAKPADKPAAPAATTT